MSDKPPPRLLDQLRAKARLLHYSLRTEEAYADWVKRFILFHGKRHPREMGAAEIEAFLGHLAVEKQVAASTQNQAFSAILFLYQKVLEIDLPRVDALRAKRPERLPVVLSVDEVRAVLDRIDGVERLQAELLYGAGLRLLECCRLRVKDIDFDRRQLTVRDGKGEKDRMAPLPVRLESKLRAQAPRSFGGAMSRMSPRASAGFGLPYAYVRRVAECGSGAGLAVSVSVEPAVGRSERRRGRPFSASPPRESAAKARQAGGNTRRD